MQLLQHFERNDLPDYTLYRLTDDGWNPLLAQLAADFRICYIEDSHLEDISTKNGISKSDCLEHFVLPEVGKIKSGDFGEMFCYFAVIENFASKGVTLVGPKKWQWKDDRNEPCHKCDCILLHMADPCRPSENDLAVSVESKMKAVSNWLNYQLQNAIDGAMSDRKSRMIKTLNWLKEKYGRLGETESRRLAERFCFPVEFGNFERKHKAIVVVDADLEDEEIGMAINKPDDITVLVFVIEDLQELYEQNYVNIIESV